MRLVTESEIHLGGDDEVVERLMVVESTRRAPLGTEGGISGRGDGWSAANSRLGKLGGRSKQSGLIGECCKKVASRGNCTNASLVY